MKRTNAPPIAEGLRITLNGEQEWKDVMQVFEDAGWVWVSGSKPHKKQICSYNTVETSSNKKIANSGCVPITTELTAEQFLQQYQGTIEYKVGDWVVIIAGYKEEIGNIYQLTGHDDVTWYIKHTKLYPNSRMFICEHDLRPATPEEIASVTKVVPKDPDVYIWDGDVLPDEYWVENPWPGTRDTEFVQLFKKMDSTANLSGEEVWYYVKNNAYYQSQEKPNTNLPIVPYELWKSILEQPVSEAEPAVTKWSIVTTDGVTVYEGHECYWYHIARNELGFDEAPQEIRESDSGIGSVWLLFSTFEAAEKYILMATLPTTDTVWKVGDILPSEWLNSVEDFRTYKGKSRGSEYKFYSSHRAVEQVKEGWALISDTSDLWLAPKDQYPTYLTESTVKENIVPVGWKPGDSWRHRDGTCGLSISVHPKDGDSNMYFIDYGENATAWVEVNVINEFVAKGLWIINPDQKSKQKEKQSQTIISKQTKTKQNEKGNSISITEQCIVISSNINCKTSNATYVLGDEERIAKGQRRQGFTVRG